MNQSLSVSIPRPCSEKWNYFKPEPDGAFCSSCNKVVINFTKMSDDEILDFLKKKRTNTCGRFRPEQLKTYSATTPPKINAGLTLLKAGFLSLLFVLVSRQTSAQRTTTKTQTEIVQHPYVENEKTMLNSSNTIRGIVRSQEDNTVLPGINVILKGSAEGTVTDADGRFEFPRKLEEGDVLVFTFIGFNSKEYIIPKTIEEEIPITMALSYVEMMGEVAVDVIYTTNQSGFRRWWGKLKALF